MNWLKNLFAVGEPTAIVGELPTRMNYQVKKSTTGKLMMTCTGEPIPEKHRDSSDFDLQEYLQSRPMFPGNDWHVVILDKY